jgi:hypothetical protein
VVGGQAERVMGSMTGSEASRCPVCGWDSAVPSAYCALCGASLTVPDEQTANAVAGAPVQAEAHPAAATLREAAETMMLAVRDSVTQSVNDSLTQSLDSVRQSMAQSITQWTGAIENPRRRARVQYHLARLGLATLPAPLVVHQLPFRRRLVYFILVGSWLSVLWVIATWLLMLSVAGRPLAEQLIAEAPRALTLHRSDPSAAPQHRPAARLPVSVQPSVPLPARAIYFLVIGCWASLLWLIVVYVVRLAAPSPVAEALFERAPTVAYLEYQ